MKKLFLLIGLLCGSMTTWGQQKDVQQYSTTPAGLRSDRTVLTGRKPLILVVLPDGDVALPDSVQLGGKSWGAFEPAWIQQIDVLRDAEALAPYGEAGQSGVVRIILRDADVARFKALIKG